MQANIMQCDSNSSLIDCQVLDVAIIIKRNTLIIFSTSWHFHEHHIALIRELTSKRLTIPGAFPCATSLHGINKGRLCDRHIHAKGRTKVCLQGRVGHVASDTCVASPTATNPIDTTSHLAIGTSTQAWTRATQGVNCVAVPLTSPVGFLAPSVVADAHLIGVTLPVIVTTTIDLTSATSEAGEAAANAAGQAMPSLTATTRALKALTSCSAVLSETITRPRPQVPLHVGHPTHALTRTTLLAARNILGNRCVETSCS
mmetsp:Transcript_143873/g.365234  ORF Transcript_143873/g.365234 Transcript_143873/m.365234 type:complete len:258 (+) Transcript_143873:439-1212(+)